MSTLLLDVSICPKLVIRHTSGISGYQVHFWGADYENEIFPLTRDIEGIDSFLNESIRINTKRINVCEIAIEYRSIPTFLCKLIVIVSVADGDTLQKVPSCMSVSLGYNNALGSVSSSNIISKVNLFGEEANVDWFCVGVMNFKRDLSRKVANVFYKDISCFPSNNGNISRQLAELLETLSDEWAILERGMFGWFEFNRGTSEWLTSFQRNTRISDSDSRGLQERLSEAEALVVRQAQQISSSNITIKHLTEQIEIQNRTFIKLKESARRRDLAATLVEETFLINPTEVNSSPINGSTVTEKVKQQEGLIMSIKEQLINLTNRMRDESIGT